MMRMPLQRLLRVPFFCTICKWGIPCTKRLSATTGFTPIAFEPGWCHILGARRTTTTTTTVPIVALHWSIRQFCASSSKNLDSCRKRLFVPGKRVQIFSLQVVFMSRLDFCDRWNTTLSARRSCLWLFTRLSSSGTMMPLPSTDLMFGYK